MMTNLKSKQKMREMHMVAVVEGWRGENYQFCCANMLLRKGGIWNLAQTRQPNSKSLRRSIRPNLDYKTAVFESDSTDFEWVIWVDVVLYVKYQ